MKCLIPSMCSLVLLLAAANSTIAQNLVKNPGMQAKCSSGYAEITKTENWTNANGGTVDLFTKNTSKHCHEVNDIPTNYMGYQAALQPSQNYAGIIAFYDDGNNNSIDSTRSANLGLKDGYKKYSEYLQGELAQPLVAGSIYKVSFKISLANKSSRAVSGIGALLTSEKIEQSSNTFLSLKPQFISYSIISDSANWITLSGAYIAAGGEKFITIGCFKDEHFQMKKTTGPLQNDSRKAYYYLADVDVSVYPNTPDLDAIIYGADFTELMDLQFVTGSSEIETQFTTGLDGVAKWMILHPKMNFFIAGYADKTGTNSINDPLSVNRAKEVKKYLVNKGVKEDNLITEGYGSTSPIEYKLKSRLNRRVEIYYIN